MSETIKADVILNCEGLNCPTPIIQLVNRVKEMQSGQIIYMTATDPGCPADIKGFTKSSGHILLESSSIKKIFTFYIQVK